MFAVHVAATKHLLHTQLVRLKIEQTHVKHASHMTGNGNALAA
jgi:hypothetical protein